MATKTMTRAISTFPNGYDPSSMIPEAKKEFGVLYNTSYALGADVTFAMDTSVTDGELDTFIAGTTGRTYGMDAVYFSDLPSSASLYAQRCWVIDGRKPAEGVGAGTGVLSYCAAGSWFRASDDGLVEV